MKSSIKTITISLFVGLGMGLTMPAFAESIEKSSSTATEEVTQDHEIEFYDYHSGTTSTYSIFNLIHPHVNKHVIEQDKKPAKENGS
jgi:hypothetical protein